MNTVFDTISMCDFKNVLEKMSLYDLKQLRKTIRNAGDKTKLKTLNEEIKCRTLPRHGCMTYEQYMDAQQRYEWQCMHF